MVFTLDDLMSLPSVTRMHFLECSGNGRAGYKGIKPDLSPQNIDGLLCNAEWTGVPVSTILAEVGVRPVTTNGERPLMFDVGAPRTLVGSVGMSAGIGAGGLIGVP
jgi:hypothetical protein